MSTEGFKRKLSAILSADVAGYSRLMGEDDSATVRTLTGHREMMSTLIRQHQGRVVDSPGDNLLAEFESVLQGVNCAVEIQRELAERNAELPEDRVMEYRIGVNLGDVIKEGERIYGDGVNIAARLESMAEPGGICISGFVYNQVKNRLKLEYEFIGEQFVKNIKEPVPVYRVLSFPGAAAHRVIEAKRAAEKERLVSSFQGKPSIAVLPFINMSNDPDQEYFSDGITEELISALAKLGGLKVISRTSAFYFKGKDVKIRQVGEELKVDNVLEGSVRKAGNKLRITAQLINIADDAHLWSETYDREFEDVFAIQDEISRAVVENLKVKLLGMEGERLVKDYTKNTEAYELFLKGMYIFNNKLYFGFDEAMEYLEKAIEVDPDYVPAYAYLASFRSIRRLVQSLAPWDTKPKIYSLLQKALEIDDQYAETYSFIGMSKVEECDWENAQKYLKRGLELNPSAAFIHSTYSLYLAAQNRLDEAIVEAKRAVELDPLHGMYRFFFARILVYEQQFDQAIELLQELLEINPNEINALPGLGFVYSAMGMYDKAISIYQRFINIPVYSAELGYCYAKAGKKEEAQKILNDFIKREKKGYFSPFMIAIVQAGLGFKDKAFEYLDKAYEYSDPIQFWIQLYPCFSELYSDPRWMEQMNKRGLAD